MAGKKTKGNALLGGPVDPATQATMDSLKRCVQSPRQTPKVECATASDLVNELPDKMLVDMLPLIHVRLKKFDETLNTTIKRRLLIAMTKDLEDPDKCTPGLYQAVLRLIGEQIPLNEDMISGSRISELEKDLPFQ